MMEFGEWENCLKLFKFIKDKKKIMLDWLRKFFLNLGDLGNSGEIIKLNVV